MPRRIKAYQATLCAGISLTLLASAPSLGAQSNRWVMVGEGENVTVFADRVSLRRAGSRVRVWTKWRFATTREIEFFPDKKYRSEKSLDVYNCSDRTSATLQAIYYADEDAGGEVIDSRSVAESRLHFAELAPETVGEAILTFVCQASPKKLR